MGTTDLQLSVSTSGDIPAPVRARVEAKMAGLAEQVREPVLHAEVRLSAETNAVRERPAVAEATLVVNGTPIRAHVAASDLDAAVDLLEDRLRRRIVRHAERLHHEGKERKRQAQRSHDDHEWRHGDLPTQRPEWYERAADEREVIRHKTFALQPLTVDEAAFDLDALAHDFYLFTELTSELEAVVAYGEDGQLALQLPEGIDATTMLTETVTPVAVAPPAPHLRQEDAVRRLEDGGERWVFFVDDDSGRGHVLYHRYDGHYGLITPAR